MGECGRHFLHEGAPSRLRLRSQRGFDKTGMSVENSGRLDALERLTKAARCSTFVLMEVETLGIARSLGWKVHMRCNGYWEATRSMRRCVDRRQLDLETLVATRGPNFPLSRLESRLMCPSCGSRRVTVNLRRIRRWGSEWGGFGWE
jgi:hypothetical protein